VIPRPHDPGLSTPISRIRRNHGLEHATIHILSSRHPKTLLIGRSDPSGFYLYGDVATEAIEAASREALARLYRGERQLAVHPNCGTSLLTAGTLACTAAVVSVSAGRSDRWQDRAARFPMAVALTVLALIIAQPLGLSLQRRVTTEADPQGLVILDVRRLSRGRIPVHRVRTAG
jgi:hypothetical protein